MTNKLKYEITLLNHLMMKNVEIMSTTNKKLNKNNLEMKKDKF